LEEEPHNGNEDEEEKGGKTAATALINATAKRTVKQMTWMNVYPCN
jgi:hypothetical protein